MHDLSSRSRLLVVALGAALLNLGATGPAHAQAPSTSVALVAPSCRAEVIDMGALTASLRADLVSVLGTVATVTPEATDDAAYRIDLTCRGADAIEVTLTRAAPRAVEHDRISVVDVELGMRPRTVSLALAERVRGLSTRPAETPPPSLAESVTPETRPMALPSDARMQRERLTRNLAIGFAAVTVATVVIGAPLVAIGGRSPPNNNEGQVIAGSALLGIGGAALVGTAVSLGLWLHERRH